MSRVLRITDANTRKINNAVFDNWTSGAPNSWTSTGSPTTAQTVSEGTIQTFASAYALDIRNASTQAIRGYYQDVTDVNEGQTYYISVYVKPTTGNVRLYAWDGGGTSNAEFVESSGTEWQQLIVEKTAVSTGIRIGLIAFDAGSQAVFDLVQLATFNIEFIEGVYSSFFRVTNWEVQVPDYKGSGVFSSSPVAEGRKLIDGYWDNVVQTITFHLRGDGDTDITTQNAAAEKLSELFNALQAARDFSKTSWVRDPVYMQYKADNETNYRYAFIANARIPQLADQYNIEFAQLVMLDLDLIIEHPVAFGMPPGEGAPVLSGWQMTDSGQDYGNYDENGDILNTAEWVYLSNQHNLQNISNMHQGTGGANQIGSSLPRVITTSGGTVYFGISGGAGSAFSNIVFYISRVAVGTSTGTWQYWNGSTWSTLTVHNSSNGFQILGNHSISFDIPSDWATTSPGALPSGYWIRFVHSGSWSVTPRIGREIYTACRNYVELPVNAVSGNIPSLFSLAGLNLGVSGDNVNRVIGGLRSLSRGAEFQSIINLGDRQNDSDINILYDGQISDTAVIGQGSQVAFVARSNSTTPDLATTITISGTLAQQYTGEFRAFLVIQKPTTMTVTANLEYRQTAGLAYTVNESVQIGTTATSLPYVLDLGGVILDEDSNGGSLPSEVTFIVKTTADSTSNFDRCSLILIPVDEYQFESWVSEITNTFSHWRPEEDDYAHVGSVLSKKILYRNQFIVTEGIEYDRASMTFLTKSNGFMTVQASDGQRLHMLMVSMPDQNDHWRFMANTFVKFRPFINPRYLGMRGSQ